MREENHERENELLLLTDERNDVEALLKKAIELKNLSRYEEAINV